MNIDTPQPQPNSQNDFPYVFGRPASTYLAPRQIVRLTILRSKLNEAAGRAG